MAYCTDCGTACAECAASTETQTVMDREVEMERLRTKRDVEVARIQAGRDRDTAEIYTGAETEVAEIDAIAGTEAAEAVADVLTGILTPEPGPPADPVMISDPPAETGPADTIEPRESGSPVPDEESKGSWSYW
jgi:hypothetical protein